MFATLAPIDARHEAATSLAEADRARRAIRIALSTLATVASFALVAAVGVTTIIAARVILYGLGHSDLPFFRDLLGVLGLL